MTQFIVTANKLNKRNRVPANLPDPNGIIGVVNKGFSFEAVEIQPVPNPSLGKWYMDRDGAYYWGGALTTVDDPTENQTEIPNNVLETISILPNFKRKIEQVVNAFETGSANGDYSELVKYKDYTNPATNTLMIQVTYGRSQTTEFGHLKALVQEYVNHNGIYSDSLKPYLNRIGQMPSLATDGVFCTALINAGKNDPIMKQCQDDLFEVKYYQPAYNWFTSNGFTSPLSMLVIYDSTIHSGGILSFLRKRFSTVVPVNGGDEKQWISDYVNVRNNWLANHSNPLLRETVYRTSCLQQQIDNNNWDLTQTINANGVIIA